MQASEKDDRPKSDFTGKMMERLRLRRFTTFPGSLMLNLLANVNPATPSDLLDLQAPLTSAITLQPEFVALLDSCDELDDLELIRMCQNTIFLQSTNPDVVHSMLRKLVNDDPLLEQALVALRRAYLRSVHRQPDRIQPEHFETMVTLAAQCFGNEYVFYQTPEEKNVCGELLRSKEAEDSGPAFAVRILAQAMYDPLYSLSLNERQLHALSQQGESMQDLIARQLLDRALESELAPGIPSFGHIDNEVSRKVRQQYEEAPYPRWIDFITPDPREFRAHIRKKFPFLEELPSTRTLDCLVAGCGTGQQALKVAAKYRNSSVVAVDLSRKSLAYGMRQASRYGFANIEFVHGDLLQVGLLQRKFDFIEAVGVLHHMEDPLRGLQALTEVLRPGGFMKIAVYRRSFRERLKPARKRLRARLKSFATSDVQAARHEFLADSPLAFEFPVSCVDFYYASGFRDLLCHVHETSFTPSELKEPLGRLNLSFLGVDYSDTPDVRAAFLNAHPAENSARDLDLCEEYEARNAEQMPSLLEFWVRKKDGGESRP